MYYASFGLLALIIHIIINYGILKIRKANGEALQLSYKNFLSAVMVYYISDIAWGFLAEWKILPLVYTDTVIYFVTMALSVLFWTRYVVAYLNRGGAFSKFITVAGWVIFVAGLIALAINLFVPIFFSFDAEKHYQPRRARYLLLGILMFFNLTTSVYTLNIAHKSEGNERLHHRAIGLSGIMMTVFIVFQSLYPFLPFYAIGCLLTTCLIHTFVVAEDKHDRHIELDSAKNMAYTDSLTGIKNAHAYAEAIKCIDKRIEEDLLIDFGVIVFDLNGLKMINDTLGHETGNKYIKNASSLICNQFKHSPVFRIGGDEFVAFLEGCDYQNRTSLINAFEYRMEQNQNNSFIVIADGFAKYLLDQDSCYQTIFERADKKMYERKKALKEMQKSNS